VVHFNAIPGTKARARAARLPTQMVLMPKRRGILPDYRVCTKVGSARGQQKGRFFSRVAWGTMSAKRKKQKKECPGTEQGKRERGEMGRKKGKRRLGPDDPPPAPKELELMPAQTIGKNNAPAFQNKQEALVVCGEPMRNPSNRVQSRLRSLIKGHVDDPLRYYSDGIISRRCWLNGGFSG